MTRLRGYRSASAMPAPGRRHAITGAAPGPDLPPGQRPQLGQPSPLMAQALPDAGKGS